jgi:hypothetical protein
LVHSPGVLRVPGNHETISQLQQLVDAGQYETFTAMHITCEDAASVLKLYIRKLTESIISAELERTVNTEFPDLGMFILMHIILVVYELVCFVSFVLMPVYLS